MPTERAHYYLEREVTLAEYIKAEQKAGIRQPSDKPDQPASPAFGNRLSNVRGRIEYR